MLRSKTNSTSTKITKKFLFSLYVYNLKMKPLIKKTFILIEISTYIHIKFYYFVSSITHTTYMYKV